MLKLHDGILVELGVDLSLFTDVHPGLVIVTLQAFEIQATAARILLEPLLTDLSWGDHPTEPSLFRREKVFILIAAIRLKLSLHGIILCFLIHLFDLIPATCRRQPLMRQHTIDLLLHSGFLFFSHMGTLARLC